MLEICILVNVVITREGIPELRDPALVCLSAIDKKAVYWSSSWARILNVQDIIKERTKETSSNISSPCIPSITIAGAGQHLFNTCLRCTAYRGCRPTLNPGFNVGPALQPIAGSMPLNNLQCSPNTVCDAGQTLFHPKPFKLLTTNVIVNIYFFWTLVKDKSTYPKDLKCYIAHVHNDSCTDMWTVSHTQHPSVP